MVNKQLAKIRAQLAAHDDKVMPTTTTEAKERKLSPYVTSGFPQLDILMDSEARGFRMPMGIVFWGKYGLGKTTLTTLVLKHLRRYYLFDCHFNDVERKYVEELGLQCGFHQYTELYENSPVISPIQMPCNTKQPLTLGESILNYCLHAAAYQHNTAIAIDTVGSFSWEGNIAELSVNPSGPLAFTSQMLKRFVNMYKTLTSNNPYNILIALAQATANMNVSGFGGGGDYKAQLPNAMEHIVQSIIEFKPAKNSATPITVAGQQIRPRLKVRLLANKASGATRSEQTLIFPFYPKEFTPLADKFNLLILAEEAKLLTYDKKICTLKTSKGSVKLGSETDRLAHCQVLDEMTSDVYLGVYKAVVQDYKNFISYENNTKNPKLTQKLAR